MLSNIFSRFYSKCETLADCEMGTYGVDCNETCGLCRDLNHCFNTNGTFLNGCYDGYQGAQCKTGK